MTVKLLIALLASQLSSQDIVYKNDEDFRRTECTLSERKIRCEANWIGSLPPVYIEEEGGRVVSFGYMPTKGNPSGQPFQVLDSDDYSIIENEAKKSKDSTLYSRSIRREHVQKLMNVIKEMTIKDQYRVN